MNFLEYLIEAQFSEADLERIIKVFERRAPKLLGGPIYRYGGKKGVEQLPGASVGYLFFFATNRAFRIRARAGKILGIDVWTNYHPFNGPNFVIHVEELAAEDVIGAIKEIASMIKNPKVGKIEVKTAAVTEGIEQLDEMAKRVDADSFYQMMVKSVGKADAESATWDQIKSVANENDVLIPAYIRDQKIGRGKWNTKPGSVQDISSGKETESDVNDAASKKKAPIMYIKVTAQDPDTKKFISADTPEAQALYKQLQTTLKAPPSEEELRDPETLYGHMAQLVQMACKGSLRSLLIYGGPGTGKTFTIMNVVNDAGLSKGSDYVKLSGKATAAEIYKTLFMYRKNGLVIFDDLDSMWGNQDATNILKAALDTSDVREIAWASRDTVNVSRMSDKEREEFNDKVDAEIEENPANARYPSMFDFTGRVIFISNLRKDQFDTAIMSRSAKINMDLTPAEILQRMRNILPTLGGNDVSLDKKQALLDHLLEMHGKGEITAVTMREFIKGLNIVRSGVPNWKELIQYA
jgi:hypothetical protein